MADTFSTIEALHPFTKYWDIKALNTSVFDRPKNRATIILLKPHEFIKLAAPTKGNKPNPEKSAIVEKYAGRWDSLPYFNVKYTSGKTAKITGHEGRHRAFYLMSKGVYLMPVVLRTTGLRWGESKARPEFLEAEKSSYKYPCPPSLIWDKVDIEDVEKKTETVEANTMLKLVISSSEYGLLTKCNTFIGLPFVPNATGKEVKCRIHNRIDLNLIKQRLVKIGFEHASGDDNWYNRQLKLNAIIRKVLGGAYELTITEGTL